MQIVINIPKGRYEDILSGKEFTLYQCDVREVLKNGTPLPKGHGRLIDADNITFSRFFDAGDYAQAMRGIYEAPTIIEAGKEE